VTGTLGPVRLAAAALLAAFVAAACASASPGSGSALHFQRVAGGFTAPTFVTAPRTEPTRLYVVEKTGRVIVMVNGKRRAQPFLDLTGKVSTGSEQGLLSLAFDPNYARNHLIYVDYTDPSGDTRVVRYRTNGQRALPATRVQLLFVDQPFENHNGGLVAFGPDRKLYVGMGDGGSGGDPGNRAQNLGIRLGKLLRRDGNSWRVAAYGLRNPWRYSWDRATGDLYVGDVGQGAWEEVDYLPRSSGGLVNFGWSVYEGNAKFKDAPLNTAGRLVGPVQVYDHSGKCSITGGYVYRGTAVPAAKGLYFYGDYCSGDLWSVKAGGAGAPTHLAGRIPNLSSFGENARGELYATSLDGSLWRLRG
jgi:glucose/arabinose dehydrogenase